MFFFYMFYNFSKIRGYHGRDPTKTQLSPYSNVKFIANTHPKMTEMCKYLIHVFMFSTFFSVATSNFSKFLRRDFIFSKFSPSRLPIFPLSVATSMQDGRTAGRQDGKMAGQDGPPNVRGGLADVVEARVLLVRSVGG